MILGRSVGISEILVVPRWESLLGSGDWWVWTNDYNSVSSVNSMGKNYTEYIYSTIPIQVNCLEYLDAFQYLWQHMRSQLVWEANIRYRVKRVQKYF